jgi:hypothetical protein
VVNLLTEICEDVNWAFQKGTSEIWKKAQFTASWDLGDFRSSHDMFGQVKTKSDGKEAFCFFVIFSSHFGIFNIG